MKDALVDGVQEFSFSDTNCVDILQYFSKVMCVVVHYFQLASRPGVIVTLVLGK